MNDTDLTGVGSDDRSIARWDAALVNTQRLAGQGALVVLAAVALRWSLYTLAGVDVLRLVVILVHR